MTARLRDALRRRRNRFLMRDYTRTSLDDPQAIAIFPRLRLVYNRIKKSGNTTVVAFLSDLEDASVVHGTASAYKTATLRPLDLDALQMLRARCYTTSTFVRNPFARVLSAFRQKVANGEHDRHRDVPGFGRDDPEGFSEFLGWLDADGLHQNRHWWPQTDLLMLPAARFDHVGKLENIVADMRDLLELIGADPGKADRLEQPHAVSRHSTSSNERVATYYASPRSVDTVRSLYARDFEAFEYDTTKFEL